MTGGQSLFSDPAFWTAASAVAFACFFGARLLKQIRAILKERYDHIISELGAVDMAQRRALSELEYAQTSLQEGKALTKKWVEDAKKHAHAVEQESLAVMQYRRELARHNLELHLQDMRIRLLQELSRDFLKQVAGKLQMHGEAEGPASLLEGLHKPKH